MVFRITLWLITKSNPHRLWHIARLYVVEQDVCIIQNILHKHWLIKRLALPYCNCKICADSPEYDIVFHHGFNLNVIYKNPLLLRKGFCSSIYHRYERCSYSRLTGFFFSKYLHSRLPVTRLRSTGCALQAVTDR